jgi:hypothetical protein
MYQTEFPAVGELADGDRVASHRSSGELKAASRQRTRSLRTDVRNPLLALPSMRVLQSQPTEIRAVLRALLKDLAGDARSRAENCWQSHKAPMAAYWKGVWLFMPATPPERSDEESADLGTAPHRRDNNSNAVCDFSRASVHG